MINFEPCLIFWATGRIYQTMGEVGWVTKNVWTEDVRVLGPWKPCIYRDLRSFFGLKKIGGSRVGRLEKRHSNRCCGSGCDFLGPRQVLSRAAWPVWCGGGARGACCSLFFNPTDFFSFVWGPTF